MGRASGAERPRYRLQGKVTSRCYQEYFNSITLFPNVRSNQFTYPIHLNYTVHTLGVLLDEPSAAAVPLGVPVCGQQQADDHLQPDPAHHLHHPGGGIHQHRARTPLQSRAGYKFWRIKIFY